MFDVPWSGGNEVLLATLAEIGLSKRLVTSMRIDGIVLVGAFVQLNEVQVLRRQGLGRKSFNEAKDTLSKFGLWLGMELQGWDDDLAHEARSAYGRKLYKRVFELNPTDWGKKGSLDEELKALLLEVENERNTELLSCYYGFDGLGPKTLESVGRPYGLTRERVRQIAARAEQKLKTTWRPLRQLDAAKRLLISGIRRPFTQNEFSEALIQSGIAHSDFHVEGVLRALEIIGDSHPICHSQVGTVRLYGKDEEVSVLKELLFILRKETSRNGCTNISRLALLIGLKFDDAAKVRDLLSEFPEVHWLDKEMNWVLSTRPTRNRLINIACRVFSVAQSVEMNELRAAMLRHVRVTFVPPADVLAEILRFHKVAKIKDRKAIASPNIDMPELGINDMGLVLAFEELGSPLTREQLENYCIDNLGMNSNSFYQYLSYSPFVVKLATSVFSLVGRDVDPGTIEQMRADIKERYFEASSGWSKVGTLWWHFQVDRPTVNGGSHSVPTFILNLTSGEWIIQTADGLGLGSAKVDNGFISGLKLAFAVLGISNKDFIQIDFDIAARTVSVRIVGDEPEEFSLQLEEDEFDHEECVKDED